MTGLRALLILAAGLWSLPAARAEIKLPHLFADHMVVQQGKEIPVWGTGEPGETVTVGFAGATAQARADAQGAWKTRLPALEGGRIGELTVAGSLSANRIALSDVAVGEVWICSGQSNMSQTVRDSRNAAKEIAAAGHPGVRLFQIPIQSAGSPAADVNAAWKICSPETVGDFSGAAYFFGRELSRKLKVPVGLIQSAVGGTVAEAWVPPAVIGANPRWTGLFERRKRIIKASDEEIRAAREKLEAEWSAVVDPLFAEAARPDPAWFAAEVPGEGWSAVRPGEIDIQLRQPVEGSFWLRKSFTLPAEHANEAAVLHLGRIDDYDFTWINGLPVGRTGRETADAHKVPRDYAVPAGTLRSGTNVVVIRLIDVFGSCGFTGPRDDNPLHLTTASGFDLSLEGPWQARLEKSVGVKPVIPGNRWHDEAGALYDGMIAPLVPYAIRGVIWYQGESNTGRAGQYRDLFPALIRSWRAAWGDDFPFYYVQLANFQKRRPQPGESIWAELRDAQLATLRIPKTGMAVAIDIGEAADIHPRNKQDIGGRLARIALAKTYGQPVASSGPVYKSKVIKGNRIGLKFAHATGGLMARPLPAIYDVRVSKGETAPLVRNSPKSELEGFAICGKDRQWVWANARIEGNRVWVWSERVASPVAVRYAWADNPVCNLYNRAGLPASPFRTDDFELTTALAR